MSLAVRATGLLSYTATDATDGRIVTIGSITYTLKTGALTAAGHVKIAAGNPDRTAANLANAVNQSGGTPGTDYYAGQANSRVIATLDAVEDQIRFDARVAGADGNSIAVTSNEPEFTVPGTLSGGIDGTTVVAWSLLTLDEAKIALRARSDAADEEITSLLTEVAALVENELLFRPVADLGTGDPEEDTDEYHDLGNPQGYLYVRRRPIRSVTSVYLNGSLLDASNYVVDMAAGSITLQGSSITRPQNFGVLGRGMYAPLGFIQGFPEDAWRFGGNYFPAMQGSGRVLYQGGFAATETVDHALKNVAYDILARLYRTRERKSQGIISEVAQGLAIATKYDTKTMNDDIRARLRPFSTLSKTARG